MKKASMKVHQAIACKKLGKRNQSMILLIIW